jgi:hypothetical protein
MTLLRNHRLFSLVYPVISLILEGRRGKLNPQPTPLTNLIRKLVRDVVPASLLIRPQRGGNELLLSTDGAFVHGSSKIILYIQ